MKGWIIKLTPENCLAIGGHTASWFADKATARDHDGYPVIPATALKGALSIEAERLFGESKARSIFGTGLLRFDDAELLGKARELYKDAQDGASPGYQRRVGVAISRRTRTVQTERLFDWETTAPFLKDAEFRAEITCTTEPTEEQKKLLEDLWKALRVTGLAIGAAKSRGLGHFKFDEEELSGATVAMKTLARSDKSEYIVRLVPEEEFRTSRLKARQYLMETEDYIPGATFRGAVAKAIGYNNGDVFDRLFKQTTVRFGPLYPS
ncbi:MAG: RAMP superfamily CRISPR-associated protein, partial [candidate division WOR-3 bacterium]